MAMFFAMPGREALAQELAELTASDFGALEVRQFPDGESYVRILSDVTRQDVFLVCGLDYPDAKFLSLAFAARTIRSLGASSIGLIAPYLPYLRQDKAFEEGEAITSKVFADLLGREFDSLITIDPHLHRYASLDAVYGIPTRAVCSAELIGHWVKENVDAALIVGPDSESAQWVEEIARAAGTPWFTFRKERRGDRDVQLAAPSLTAWRDHIPVLVDDIVSSGTTMVEGAKLLRAAGLPPPYCIAFHALFDEATGARIERLARKFLTTDTVPNKFSYFRVAPLMAGQLSSEWELAGRMPAP